MTPHEFIAKWRKANLSERSACQQHFLDLCALLGEETPAAADPDGSHYTFEKGVRKQEGGQGFADVWKRGAFGWEYKGKHKDLKAAYNQLLQYREDLENPPLLVVCDLDRFEIHTNFTGTIKQVHAFALKELADPKHLDLLRRLFADPESLKPGLTPEEVTQEAAEKIGQIADRLRVRAVPAPDAAHFLMKLMFCMFAEDIELLPEKLFSRILKSSKGDSKKLAKNLGELFQAMTKGGDFWGEEVLYFNGGLFADADVIELTPDEIQDLNDAAIPDWSNVAPHVFGTLFERCLDPSKRSQIGAHYTSRADIETLLEPVVMAPLRREWEQVKAKAEELNEKVRASNTDATRKRHRTARDQVVRAYLERLSHVTILDPACGSGNFLYVALRMLLDLEKEVIAYSATLDRAALLPQVSPTQLAGIEINAYAQQLASVVIWIGYLQWLRDNGFSPPRDPVLKPIESIEQKDAILDLSDPAHPKEPDWPEAEFIVGNPPFLGNRLLAAHYDSAYLKPLYALYSSRLSGKPDLCCYWFEKARAAVRVGRTSRVGLLATQGIRGGTNRNVLTKIKETGDIFFAVSDREWLLDGAMVHVSLVGFDDGSESHREVDGVRAVSINANLTTGTDITSAIPLRDNQSIAFQGGIKRGSFDVDDERALEFLKARGNPNGRPNSDVMFPYANATDVTQHNRHCWIIHFGKDMPMDAAARYNAPFAYLDATVRPERLSANQESARARWWLHWNVRGELEESLATLDRWIVTPRVSKHRVFAWAYPPTYVDNALVAFARDDDYTLGVLHSRFHEVWARAQGTQLRERESGFRYTPTTCFDTFPFPEPTAQQRMAIANAARELDGLRCAWLSPPEWTTERVIEFPGAIDGPWKRYIERTSATTTDIGIVRYPRTVPRDEECAKQLNLRTLTSLYNDRPAWLAFAHHRLDQAVAGAYGFSTKLTDSQVLEALLDLNVDRAARRNGVHA